RLRPRLHARPHDEGLTLALRPNPAAASSPGSRRVFSFLSRPRPSLVAGTEHPSPSRARPFRFKFAFHPTTHRPPRTNLRVPGRRPKAVFQNGLRPISRDAIRFMASRRAGGFLGCHAHAGPGFVRYDVRPAWACAAFMSERVLSPR